MIRLQLVREIVEARCTCGGSGPHDPGACDWCLLWHDAVRDDVPAITIVDVRDAIESETALRMILDAREALERGAR